MRDILLQCSGVLAIAAAITHGVLTETKIFPRVTIEPERLRTLFRMVWQIPTVAWIACGVLLIALPSFASEPALDFETRAPVSPPSLTCERSPPPPSFSSSFGSAVETKMICLIVVAAGSVFGTAAETCRRELCDQYAGGRNESLCSSLGLRA